LLQEAFWLSSKREFQHNSLNFKLILLNGVAVGNQILENVLLAFKMSRNCHFQIKWLDNPEYKKMVGYGK
jgi:hypothetical protein